MRHSKKMGNTSDDVKRVRHIERRYLKRAHQQHVAANGPIALKTFAAEAVLDAKKEARAASGDPTGSTTERLGAAGAFWLQQKTSKQVRTVHPKRVKKPKGDKVKMKKVDDDDAGGKRGKKR